MARVQNTHRTSKRKSEKGEWMERQNWCEPKWMNESTKENEIGEKKERVEVRRVTHEKKEAKKW